MSHTKKQEIFDNYAKEQGYKDWEAIIWEFECHLANADELNLHIFAACDLVQAEQQERIAENALIRHDLNKLNEPNSAEYGKYFGGEGSTFYTVEKTSITNPENLIK